MREKECIIFCHGWAGNISFWDNLKLFFDNNVSNNIEIQYLDLGYFGNNDSIKQFSYNNLSTYIHQNKQLKFIGIGHSIGLIKLLSLNIEFKALVGLQSFINFLGNDPLLNQKRKLEWLSLKQQFKHNPLDTLRSFYKLANLNPSFIENLCNKKELFNKKDQRYFLNENFLTQDLELLSLGFSLPKGVPTLIVGAMDDVIVPPVLIFDNFSHLKHTKVDMLDTGQHSIGYRSAGLIYQKIKFFLQAKDNLV